MIPILRRDECRDLDAAAPDPVEVLISRAGGHVGRVALEMLGGGYGRRVAVVAGAGNNGRDGVEAARRLRRAGVHVDVVDAQRPPDALTGYDLVIDAAFGTDFHGSWPAPRTDAPVLAVDLPSGVDADTGAVEGPTMRADVTVTFQALKPGLILQPGRSRCGQVHVVDIGLDPSDAQMWLVDAFDVERWWPPMPISAHKWGRAVYVVAGSDGMTGAARLVARGAQRAGAGMVRVGTRASSVDAATTTEAIGRRLREPGWGADLFAELGRFGSLVIGPGLGRGDHVAAEVRQAVAMAPVPVVIDADGLSAFDSSRDLAAVVAERSQPTVLTPHDGEFARLFGEPSGDDRAASVRQLATVTGAVVLLKGPTTLVADPSGSVLVVANGDQRLATAGTGDVLSGIVGTVLAGGLDAARAAAAAAWVHAAAARRGAGVGLVASDVADGVPVVLDSLVTAEALVP